MTRLFSFLTILSLLFGQAAYAAERVPSTTATATGLARGTGFGVDGGGDLTATGVYGARAATTATIVKGRTYRYTANVTLSAGTLHLYAGGVSHTNGGRTLAAPALTGIPDIPDRWNTTGALGTVGIEVDEPDANFSFRFNCYAGQLLRDDPLLLPNWPGAAHLHQFWGNKAINANSTPRNVRQIGGTTCGEDSTPFWRTGYWMPAMLDGMGNAVKFNTVLNYYKGLPSGIPECQGAPDATHVGICIQVPNGIGYIFGYDHARPNELPSIAGGTTKHQNDIYYAMSFKCNTSNAETSHPSAPGTYRSLKEVYDAGCPVGAYLQYGLIAPDCWNGTQLLTANGRDHMEYSGGPSGAVSIQPNAIFNDDVDGNDVVLPANWTRCPTSHPYMLPQYTAIVFLGPLPASWATGKWHFSSDEQRIAPTDAGATLHMDYLDGQSPIVKPVWFGPTGCGGKKDSCNSGALGDGTTIRGMGGRPSSTPVIVPLARAQGWSRPFEFIGTRTYTGEIVAPASGELGWYGYNGATGTVNSWSIVDVTRSNTTGPVTTSHTH